MQSIEVTLTKDYGRERYIPANDEAKRYLALLKQATFTREDLEGLKRLGHAVLIKGQETRAL